MRGFTFAKLPAEMKPVAQPRSLWQESTLQFPSRCVPFAGAWRVRGERAVRTWTVRMRILKELGFIDIKGRPNDLISYVLIFQPLSCRARAL